jgi:hypothetical protein
MAYVPDWETLAETLARVMMTTGLSTSEAQLDICRALKDGKLRARYTVERVQTPYRFDLDPRAVGQPRSTFDQRDIIGRPRVPPDLNPNDIDWENSRPKSPWLDNRRFLVGITKIEVSTAVVIRVLCSGIQRVSPSYVGTEEPPAKKVLDQPITTAVEEKILDQPITRAAEGKRPTAADVARAAKALEAQLRINNQMRTAEAKDFCTSIGISWGGVLSDAFGERRAYRRA